MESLPYRLDELGWLQFERLCELVLGADGVASEPDWIGRADVGRVAVVEAARAGRRPAPLTVLVIWVPAAAGGADGAVELAWRVSELPFELGFLFGERVLVLTNVDDRAALQELRRHQALGGRELTVLGAAAICERLDRHPAIRAAMPAVLGLRDLAPLVSAAARARSTLDVERAQALARVFWPTRAYQRAREVLARHRFAVLTGPPEMGKTAIAQMLGLAKLTDGWDVHECSSPDQVWRAFDTHGRQLFIADDAFGSTEYRADAAERWAGALGRLLAMLDDRHWLIWTSRPAPLKAGLRRVQRERGSERFPAPGEVLVDASDLDLAEKTLILFRHARAGGVSGAARTWLRSEGVAVVEHPHFTPERIRRLVADRLGPLFDDPYDTGLGVRLLVQRELAVPTEAMRLSYHALEDEHRGVLVAMLDGPAGLIEERELAALARRHHSGGLSRPPHELIDRLTDHFLRVTPLGIGWVHPSWRDLVIDELRADRAARLRFLDRCGIHGAILALSRGGGASGERVLPLLVEDGDWDRLGDRLTQLAAELDDHSVGRLLTAVADAFDPRVSVAQHAELSVLASVLLASTARRWDVARRPLSAFVLEAWYELDSWLEEPVAPPSLGWSWAELHPGSPPLGRGLRRDELAALEEWLVLAEALARHDSGSLRGLGFYGPDQQLLADLIGSLRRTSDPDLRPAVEAVLERIKRLAPRQWDSAELAIEASRQAALSGPDWWVPEDLPAPPSYEPVTLGPIEFTRDDVARVLADL